MKDRALFFNVHGWRRDLWGKNYAPKNKKSYSNARNEKKVLSVFLNKHRYFEARHDWINVRKASHSGVNIFP